MFVEIANVKKVSSTTTVAVQLPQIHVFPEIRYGIERMGIYEL